MSRLSVELLENDSIISRKILKALSDEFNALAIKKVDKIRQKIATETISFLQKTDTYNSLVDGELAGHFGLSSQGRQQKIDNILHQIVNSIKIEFQPVKIFGAGFSGGIEIYVLVADFSDILSLPDATVITEKGQILSWLSWLLIEGDRIIISQHDVKLIQGKGRSGFAIMIKNNSRAWRVPSEYSGTYSDNWLTRSFSTDGYSDYTEILTRILKEELS